MKLVDLKKYKNSKVKIGAKIDYITSDPKLSVLAEEMISDLMERIANGIIEGLYDLKDELQGDWDGKKVVKLDTVGGKIKMTVEEKEQNE